MTRRLISGIGPENDDYRLWSGGQAQGWPASSGISTPTTTADSVAPPQGTRWLAVTYNASGTEYSIISGQWTVALDAIGWAVCRAYRLHGTLNAGNTCLGIEYAVKRAEAEHNLQVGWERVSNTTFHFRVVEDDVTVKATGTTAFNTDTSHSWRLTLDGTNATLEVNGVQELTFAYTGKYYSSRINVHPIPASGQTHYYRGIIVCDAPSSADRPGVTVEMDHLNVGESGNGDWATEQEYGDDANCAPGSTSATYTDTTLDGSDQVVATTYWCEASTEAGKQMSDLGTLSFSGTIIGCIIRRTQACNSTLKTVKTFSRISNGSTAINIELPNLGTTTFTGGECIHRAAPGGGTWESDLASLKAGLQSDAGNGATDQCCAMEVEVYAVNNDPPASGADRRRLLARVN